MNGHLTEQQLIDYAFRLASDAGMREAAAHLEGCEACRDRLEGLKRKFAALDLLRDEVKASDALVAKAVEYAATAPRARLLPLRLPWLGAVAAAVVVGIALLMQPNQRPRREAEQDASSPLPTQETPAPTAGGESYRFTPGQPASVDKEADAPALGLALAPKSAAVAPAAPAVAGSVAQAESIDEKPPFAPASAIELVVLPRRENVQLTIYNAADLTLVRERRNLTLKQGWNWLQFMWANTLIDPTSLSLEPLERKDQVQVQQLVFPPRLRELGRWLIRSETSGQVPFELTYFTSRLTWRAFYMGTLAQDEETMRLEAYVRVGNNSGEDYEDAQTRLIVGRVHLLDEIAELAKRQYPYGIPTPPPGEAGGMGGYGAFNRGKDLYWADTNGKSAGQLMESLERKEIQKEGLSEYFLYTIEGTETIPNEWGKRLLSFEADDIPVKNLYKYDEERWEAQTIRFLSFANDEEHKLGSTPLPDGTVRIYSRTDEQGHLSYVGGADVKYIPVGEEVELDLGPVRLVEVKPVLMDYKTANHVFDPNGNVAGWDEVRTWRIEVTNASTLTVDIEITRGFDTPYWTLNPGDGQPAYEKYDATHARFKLSVEPRSKRVLDYTVTAFLGVRQETLTKAELNK
jgi:hypothetical protein